MTKTTLLAIAAVAALGHAGSPRAENPAKARVIDSYTTIESTGEIRFHRTVQLPNLDTGEAETYTQVFQKTQDGSLRAIPTMTSDKLKRRRDEICAALGGVDVTDEGVVTITPGMITFHQCDLPVQEPESAKPRKQAPVP